MIIVKTINFVLLFITTVIHVVVSVVGLLRIHKTSITSASVFVEQSDSLGKKFGEIRLSVT